MAMLSVRSIAASCLGRSTPLSLREDILGVYGNDNPQGRSLRDRLNLIKNAPFVRVALVTIRPIGSALGAYRNLQRDLDNANEIYQRECGDWVYCVGSIIENTAILGAGGILDQNDCGSPHTVSAEEDDLFDLGRDLGADVVCYFITGSTNPAHAGCAAHPAGRRGFWVGFGSSEWIFSHELTHVIGNNRHPSQDGDIPNNDQDNLMWPTPSAITNLPPDLRNVQCNRITSDLDMETC